ncbi:MAG: cbb3-type cytochrome oxidase assembly protein CcoS [Acidimicrobiia bacterium]|nr:cbb3-type cytochrome oxidase assembly protein CcoS [Acidimicrobiia bacterium]
MSVIYIVLPLALVIVAAAIGAFVWAARSGQYDDVDTPAIRMLHDDEGKAESRKQKAENRKQKAERRKQKTESRR